MADNTQIEWADATWNPLVGCSIVSPGCTNCYAMQFVHRMGCNPTLHGRYAGLTRKVKGKPVWTDVVRFNEHMLDHPLRWKRQRRVFVNSLSDLFHEEVESEWIDQIFAVMALARQHMYLILTKRPKRMRDYMDDRGAFDRILEIAKQKRGLPDNWRWPPRNVWLGVSAERQQEASERIPILLRTPAALRFVSLEPLLGPIELQDMEFDGGPDWLSEEGAEVSWPGGTTGPCRTPALDWVIVGGESGRQARPLHPDWVRSLRDQCETFGVPFFFKQWGRYRPLTADEECPIDWIWLDKAGLDLPDYRYPNNKEGEYAVIDVGKKKAGNVLDGRVWIEWPQ